MPKRTKGTKTRDPATLSSPCLLRELVRWLNYAEKHSDKLSQAVVVKKHKNTLSQMVDEFNKESMWFKMTNAKLSALLGLCNTKDESDADALAAALWALLQCHEEVMDVISVDIEKGKFQMDIEKLKKTKSYGDIVRRMAEHGNEGQEQGKHNNSRQHVCSPGCCKKHGAG